MIASSSDAHSDVSTLPFRQTAIALAGLGLVPVANFLRARRAVPWWPAAVAEWTTTGLGLVVVALLLAALLGDRTDELTRRAVRVLNRPLPRIFAIGAAIVVLLLAAVLAQYCFSGRVFTDDEVVQRWHARMLLSGRLYLPTEAHREFFSTGEVLDAGGRWFSQFPIGGPAVFAAGLLLGAPWLVNPLLAAFRARNVYRFASRCFDETTTRASTMLFVVSPFVLLMSASQMNHVATLAFVALALAELATWATAPGIATVPGRAPRIRPRPSCGSMHLRRRRG
jgi:hypothetical protein